MKISAFVALAGVSAQAPAGRIFFDEDLPCDDFDAKFPPSSFPDMKTKCKTKHNAKKNKTKTRCNLICKNGQENVWSTKPIKVKSCFVFQILCKHLVQSPANEKRSSPSRSLQVEPIIDRWCQRSLRHQGAVLKPQDHVQPHQQTSQQREVH